MLVVVVVVVAAAVVFGGGGGQGNTSLTHWYRHHCCRVISIMSPWKTMISSVISIQGKNVITWESGMEYWPRFGNNCLGQALLMIIADVAVL